MGRDSQVIVQKLWSYCNILRDDGLSYPDYVEQLTYLLFLKMAHEQAHNSQSQRSIIPCGYDWETLVTKEGKALHAQYTRVLANLGHGPGMLGMIFRAAENKIRDPAKLRLLIVDLIDQENWSALDADVKGDAYEGLLERNAQDTKSGAGQYFTPRPLIQAIVECVKPRPGETICDPACGTCGFLLAAHEYILEHNPRLTQAHKEHLRLDALRGVELVPEVARLGAMNLVLHGIGPMEGAGTPPIVAEDSLFADPGTRFDVVLTNPPFGKKGSVTVRPEGTRRERQPLEVVRDDFWVSTSNKQLGFVQHVKTILGAGGRAAVVVPDNVLFEGGAGQIVRRRLLAEYDVHTLLRLPTGIFYAQGVKANVLFFDRVGPERRLATRCVWVFDLRTNVRFTLRTDPLTRRDLDEFVKCYKAGDLEGRRATWSSDNPLGRWRAFSYDELLRRSKQNLDITWLKEGDNLSVAGSDPGEIASEILDDLRAAVAEIQKIAVDLTDAKK
jgi:type I restriction enzyme M protein